MAAVAVVKLADVCHVVFLTWPPFCLTGTIAPVLHGEDAMKVEIKYGKKIRQFREARKWTQEQLAEATGAFTPRTIQRAENDETSGSETIQAIAGALDVELDALKTVRYVPESFLVGTKLITTHRQFADHDQTNSTQAHCYVIVSPLTDAGRSHVDGLVDQIFADRELIEPDERSLWRSYIEGIETPLNELFEMKMAIFTMDVQRDLILRDLGDLKPKQRFVNDWRLRYFLFIPRHGCFRVNPDEPLHRFNANCPPACAALFEGIAGRNVPGVEVAANALVAITEPDFFRRGLNWCDCCFPLHADGSRLDFEYLELVTGLDRARLYALWQETIGDNSLQGLS
jgi:transcriptional regulator with XRE-family HTH domain